MNLQEKIRGEVGEGDFANECSVDSMAVGVENTLRGICDSVRGLVRNVVFLTQLSAATLGVIGCIQPPEPPEPNDLATVMFYSSQRHLLRRSLI